MAITLTTARTMARDPLVLKKRCVELADSIRKIQKILARHTLQDRVFDRILGQRVAEAQHGSATMPLNQFQLRGGKLRAPSLNRTAAHYSIFSPRHTRRPV